MNKAFFYFAIICFFLSLLVHFISLTGYYIGGALPFIWLLHIGIFIVWIPAILQLRKKPELKNKRGPIKQFQIALQNAPGFFRMAIAFFFFYTAINFYLFMIASGGGGPHIEDGKYILQNHGDVIRELTKIEYFSLKANELRGFSGHWLLFYSFAAGVFWPKKTEKVNNH